MAYKGKPWKQMARELAVDVVIVARMNRAKTEIRAEFIRADSGDLLDTKIYTHTGKGLMASGAGGR